MPTFLHAADLHIDSPLCGLGDELGPRVRGATRTAFKKLIDLAIERRVGFLVLAGDIFDDAHQTIATTRFIADELRRLEQHGIAVFLARGNHDHLAGGPNGAWPRNVHEFSATAPETRLLPQLRVAVHGQSYPDRHVRRDLALGYPAPVPGSLNVGVLHTALEGHANGHVAYAPTTVNTLDACGYGYWALGHVHGHVTIPRGHARIVYPGNLQGRNARETGPKGAVLVTWEGTRVTKVEHVPLDVVRWSVQDIVASGDALVFAEEARNVADRLQEALQADLDAGVDCAVRLTITGVRLELLDDPVPQLEETVRSVLRDEFQDRVMLESLTLEPASANGALPAVLLSRIEEAQANLDGAAASGLAQATGDLLRRMTEGRIPELGNGLRSRTGAVSPKDLKSRALLLGQRRLLAALSRG